MLNQTSPRTLAKRYILHEQLGKGGMGIVYRATDRLTGRDVALKQLHRDFLTTEDSTQDELTRANLLLSKEFRLSASLHHPNIVDVYDYGFDEHRTPYFTMALLQNPQTLLQIVPQTSISERLEIFWQIVRAVFYLHHRGIIHRDLKPANVLVESGEVKILDFGLSGVVARNSKNVQQNVLIGTLGYVAPELLQEEEASFQSDFFALGVIGYELLAGKHPFEITNMTKLVADILFTNVDVSVLDVPIGVVNVIDRLLQKSPKDRYPSAGDLYHDLTFALDFDDKSDALAIRHNLLNSTQFIGRKQELNQLTQTLDNVLQSRVGYAMVLSGESGTGKSRLLSEFRTHIHINGTTSLRIQVQDGVKQPYAMWMTVFRWLCLINPNLIDSDVALLMPYINDLSRLLQRDISHIKTKSRSADALHQSLLMLLQNSFMQSNQPITLLFEDVQWADGESMRLLQAFLPYLDSLPIFIIMTYRTDAKTSLPADLASLPHIELKQLSIEEIRQFSTAMLGKQGSSDQVVELIHAESNGNAFHIMEAIRSLAEQVGDVELLGRTTLPVAIFSGGLSQLLQKRLDTLSPNNRYYLQLMALMGQQIDNAILNQLFSTKEKDIWLHHCQESELLMLEDNIWQFAHDQLRQVTLNSIDETRLPQMHRRVAELLESTYGTQDATRYTVLAHHWHLANNLAKEEYYTTHAAQHLLLIGQYTQVIEYLERSLNILPRLALTDAKRARKHVHINQRLASAYLGIGQYETAWQLHSDALHSMEELQDPIGIAVCRGHLGDVAFALAEFPIANEHYQLSLSLYREHENIAGIVRALNQLGNTAYEIGNSDLAKQYYQESLDLARQSGIEWGVAGTSRQNEQFKKLITDEFRRIEVDLQTQLNQTRDNNDTTQEANILVELGKASMANTKWSLARSYYAQALSIYENQQNQLEKAYTLIPLAMTYIMDGNQLPAYPLLREAIQLFNHTEPSWRTFPLVELAEYLYRAQEYAKVVELIAFVLEQSNVDDYVLDQAEALLLIINAAYDQNELSPYWEAGKNMTWQMIGETWLS